MVQASGDGDAIYADSSMLTAFTPEMARALKPDRKSVKVTLYQILSTWLHAYEGNTFAK